MNVFQRFKMAFALQKLLSSDLQSGICARVPLSEVSSAIDTYGAEMTKGKFLITPTLP